MAASTHITTIDLHTLRFAPTSLASNKAESTPPPALASATAILGSVAGVRALRLGRQLEDDDLQTWVLAIVWANGRGDADAFAASEQWMPFRAAMRSAVGDGWRTQRFDVDGAVDKVLAAPCTELYASSGVDAGYRDQVRLFADKIRDAGDGGVPGCRGVALATPAAESDDTLLLMLGWDSREAHYETKAQPGLLIDAITAHLTEGVKSGDMQHVEFRAV